MELAGHKCIGFCEFDKYAVMSYTMMHLATPGQVEYIASIPAPLKKDGSRNLNARQKEIMKEEYRNGEWYANDITTVDAQSMPRADMWLFGAPCQDFSIAGNRAGLGGDRSSLVREVFRLVAEFQEGDRPTYLVYENVKGMLSSNNGWDFACIKTEMESLGYIAEYQLLNSKHFGVPQNRERVFLVGHFRGRCTRKVFPITGAGGENSIDVVGKLPGGRRQRNDLLGVNGISTCLDTMQGGGHEPKIAIPVLTPDRAEKRHEVAVYVIWHEKYQCYIVIRRLTPKECFRLQAWTDDYYSRAELVNSDSQLYKQAGNGITVSVAEEIGQRL